MKQQSYQPLRFVYLLVALFAALLLIARPVMADEENDPWILGYKQGLTKGKEAGKAADWTDLTPPTKNHLVILKRLIKKGIKMDTEMVIMKDLEKATLC